MLYVPVNNFSVILGRLPGFYQYLAMGMKCLGQGHNNAPQVRIDQESDALPTELSVLPVIDYCFKSQDCQLFLSQKSCLLNRQIQYFLAHLSRRLIGELIVYQWSGVRPSSSSVVVRRPQCSNIFFSETAWPIKAKFYVEPPWVGGTKFCSRHLGHMTKMAATPIYGQNPSKIFFSRNGGPIFTKLVM